MLNFNCGIILFSVCRNIITLLRSTFLNRFVPFDKNITFHKAIAWTILLFTCVHVGAHYFNFLGLQKGMRARHEGPPTRAADPRIAFSRDRSARPQPLRRPRALPTFRPRPTPTRPQSRPSLAARGSSS